ncbi:MAG TPA: hypothetical protein PKM43_16775 [Verrucomicrobiota bacterium]|nr:hypothetical protein [Verrucomicrobiota bacterium]HRZ36657.1 hypothetical protein [Candidatus Paceibacterota bacterium]
MTTNQTSTKGSESGPAEEYKTLREELLQAKTAAARFGRLACFASACLIPMFVFRRFAELELTEPELLIGVVATIASAVSCTVPGLLLEPRATPARLTEGL